MILATILLLQFATFSSDYLVKQAEAEAPARRCFRETMPLYVDKNTGQSEMARTMCFACKVAYEEETEAYVTLMES